MSGSLSSWSSFHDALSELSGIHQLPDELLTVIFEKVASLDEPDSGSSRSVACVLKVCKKWHALAEPLLYRRITFGTHEHLWQIVNYFIGLHTQQRPVMGWIQYLHFSHLNFHRHDWNTTTDVVDVILHATCLQGLHLVTNTTSAPITAASLTCANTLNSLFLNVGNQALPGIMVMSRFSHLRTLTIHIWADEFPKSTSPPWILPCLRKLTWDRPQPTRPELSGQDLHFLNRCSFPVLEHLVAMMDFMEDNIQPFIQFVNQQPHVLILDHSKSYLDDQDQLTILSRVAAPQVIFEATETLPPNLTEILSPSVHVLDIRLGEDAYAAQTVSECMLNFAASASVPISGAGIDKLTRTHTRTTAGVHTIRLRVQDMYHSKRFVWANNAWMTNKQTRATVAGWGQSLSQAGIRLLDEENQEYTDDLGHQYSDIAAM